MTSRPPTSTLFPYTTLFRSQQFERSGDEWMAVEALDWESSARGLLDDPDALPLANQALERDRKSTRLNSSHTVISYAVFCLKKKDRLAAGGREIHPPPVARE